MPVTKNIAFTLLIKVDGRLREFNFRKRNDESYDGDISDERGTRYFFKMRKQEGGWSMEGVALPGWLEASQSRIEEALSQHDR